MFSCFKASQFNHSSQFLQHFWIVRSSNFSFWLRSRQDLIAFKSHVQLRKRLEININELLLLLGMEVSTVDTSWDWTQYLSKYRLSWPPLITDPVFSIYYWGKSWQYSFWFWHIYTRQYLGRFWPRALILKFGIHMLRKTTTALTHPYLLVLPKSGKVLVQSSDLDRLKFGIDMLTKI